MNAILEDKDKFLKLGDLSFDDTQKLENKLQKRFSRVIREKIHIEGGLRVYSSSRIADPECMGYQKYINLVSLCVLFFPCIILSNILWLNGLSSALTQSYISILGFV